MIARLLFLLLSLVLAGCQSTRVAQRNTGPWDMAELTRAPEVMWGSRTGLVQEVYYAGEPFQQRPTRVFAYLGRPEGPGPFPGMVLVHGGGGKAFAEWAEHWAKRGYVALAMDLSGNGPNGRLEDGGPDQGDGTKFRNFSTNEVKEMWSYHAVANVIRGHSLLATLPEVDRSRIGMTGISWGGYLTCIVAGLDHRLKAAVPVYGCGFLGENSVWKEGSLARMTPKSRALWLQYFDPSQYVGGARCPMLFLNGSHDFAYPLDSYQKTYRLVDPDLRHVSIVMNLPHGHIWSFREVDEFIDRAMRGESFPEIGPLQVGGSSVRAESSEPLRSAELNYTTDTGPWQKRKWTSIPARISGRRIEAELPEGVTMVYFLTGETKDGLRISSEHGEMGEPVSKPG